MQTILIGLAFCLPLADEPVVITKCKLEKEVKTIVGGYQVDLFTEVRNRGKVKYRYKLTGGFTGGQMRDQRIYQHTIFPGEITWIYVQTKLTEKQFAAVKAGKSKPKPKLVMLD